MLIYGIKAYILPKKKSTEALLVNRKDTVLEVNDETAKCMFMFVNIIQEKITTLKWIIKSLKFWKISNILEYPNK
jgi:hypothetical protein